MKKVILGFLFICSMVTCGFFLYRGYFQKKTSDIIVLSPETKGPYKQYISSDKTTDVDHEIYKNKKDKKYTVIVEKHHIFTDSKKNDTNGNHNKLYKSNIPVINHGAIANKVRKKAVYMALLDTVQDPIDAEKAWRVLKDSNSILKKYKNYQLHKVKKNGQVFYYIAVSNFSKASEANLLCKKLQCIVQKVYINQ